MSQPLGLYLPCGYPCSPASTPSVSRCNHRSLCPGAHHPNARGSFFSVCKQKDMFQFFDNHNLTTLAYEEFSRALSHTLKVRSGEL